MKKVVVSLAVVLILAVLAVWWFFFAGARVCASCKVTTANLQPRGDLDPELGYLDALRAKAEADDPDASAQWQADLEEYARFKSVRLQELTQHPAWGLYPDWGPDEWLGWDTWFRWTGGNAFLWRDMTQRSDGGLNLLKLLDNQRLDRSERFSRFGLINHPDARPPESDGTGGCIPDEYGLCLDRLPDRGESELTRKHLGRPSGIMGMRLFDNPQYSSKRWNPEDPWNPPAGCDPGEGREGADPAAIARLSRDDCYQPPYLVGISCGFCHISFHPENPPLDPVQPEWKNLTGTLGNVYLMEGPLFSWVLDFGKTSFLTHYLEAQPPGTSDTSRIATDDIDNPNAINAIFNLPARLGEAEEEVMGNGHRTRVPHILKDGGDSIGVPGASIRVYVNIGMMGNYWLTKHDAYLVLMGKLFPPAPFRIDEAMRTPSYEGDYTWNQTQARLADAKTFLASSRPYKLARAPGSERYLDADEATLTRGKKVFAAHCAGCHSSKQPKIDRASDPEGWLEAMTEMVLADDFLQGNFLSDDKRYPATLIGVNLCRSMASNAVQDKIWEDFSSLTYKNLPSLGCLELPHPLEEGKTVEFCAPDGGRGYYRTASLLSLWATAPFFHNNVVGEHHQDPSIEGRMAAFESAAEELLWPEKRTQDPWDNRHMKRTPRGQESVLVAPGEITVPVPGGTPIKLLGNLPLHNPKVIDTVTGDLPDLASSERAERVMRRVLDNPMLRKLVVRKLLEHNTCPDFIENKGHEAFAARIETDENKRALIELLRTF